MTSSSFDNTNIDQLLKSIIAKHHHEPPVDIEAIARRLGAEIAYESMFSDGSLEELTPNRYLIKVNRKSNRNRQRFTIAHETAHIMLTLADRSEISSSIEESFPEERVLCSGSNEEKICNSIAASLLVPSQIAKQLSDWKSLSIKKIEKAARAWQVSIDVLLWRVLDLAPNEGGFMWFQIDSKLRDPTDIGMQRVWVKFPKSRRIDIPKHVWLYASNHSPIDITGNEERIFEAKLDFNGLSGFRAIRVKAFPEGNKKKVLVIVYPEEFRPELVLSSRPPRQTILPGKHYNMGITLTRGKSGHAE